MTTDRFTYWAAEPPDILARRAMDKVRAWRKWFHQVGHADKALKGWRYAHGWTDAGESSSRLQGGGERHQLVKAVVNGVRPLRQRTLAMVLNGAPEMQPVAANSDADAREQAAASVGVLEHILQPKMYPQLYGDMYHKVRINYYPPRGDNKEGWDNIDIFGWLGYPMQIKIDFLCRDSILAAPIVLDLALFMDLAARSGMSGIQEWLSFYFKSPLTPVGSYPEHDIFIQQMKLKNTLRALMGEEPVTHAEEA